MKRERLIKNFIGLVFCALLLYWVDFSQLKTAFLQLDAYSIMLLLGVSVVLIYISALKWSLFLEALAFRVSVIKLFSYYLVGYFVNLILPSYVGGDAVRSFYVGKKVGHYEAFTSTILERYTGIVAMVVLAVLFMWSSPLVTWQVELAVVAFALGVAFITFVGIYPPALVWLEKIPRLGRLVVHLERIQEGFHLAAKDTNLILKSLLLSLFYHTFTVLNVVFAAHALGWSHPPFNDLFVVLPLILLIGSLPLSPSGLGIQEGAYYYFLQGVGATSGQALGVALLLRAKSYVLAVAGGVIWFLMRESGAGLTTESAAINESETQAAAQDLAGNGH